MQTQAFLVDDTHCRLSAFGTPRPDSPRIVMPVAWDVSELIEGQHLRLDALIESGELPPFVLGIFETPHWTDSLSPWPAPPLPRETEPFAGNAGATLAWLLERFLPTLEARASLANGTRGILGYSMGGLFALWAIHHCAAFSLCASCSGSLWYEGFAAHLAESAPQAQCAVYLSLGEREEKARNPFYARVGDATRQIAARLAASPFVTDSALVMQAGGHTGAVGQRIADALAWLLRRA